MNAAIEASLALRAAYALQVSIEATSQARRARQFRICHYVLLKQTQLCIQHLGAQIARAKLLQPLPIVALR